MNACILNVPSYPNRANGGKARAQSLSAALRSAVKLRETRHWQQGW